ncbi:MAG: SusC/RagA family TonB-linked outer membrane protein [Bacteroidales bacterium]|nr:SusC/RagA family TonB-linked outer membrane protein [Bacteroidales bacterium]
MKKALILTCLIGLLLQNVVAQSVTLNFRDAPLRDVLREIQNQTDYRFVFNDNAIGASNPVSITVESEPLRAVLTELFTQNNITYTISGRQIVLSPSTATEPAAPAGAAPLQRQVTGRVVCEASGETLPFVTVVIQGTTTGTITSIDGDFTITVPSEETVLVFSILGYEPMEIQVGTAMHLAVGKRLSATELEGVVVTGFQTLSRERSAGSFNIVSGQTVAERAATSGGILQSLEGLTTGLSINHGAGEDMFLIRGTNSVNATRQPLYVVDGIPMSFEDIELMINENDILTFTVLKDATAASIWGAQAANGVVVITTRRGLDTDRRIHVTYNTTTTVRGRPDWSYFNFMSSEQFMRTANEIFDPNVFTYHDVMTRNFGLPLNSFPLILPHEMPWYDYLNSTINATERDRRLNALASQNNRSQIEEFLQQPAWNTRHSLSFTGGGQNYSVHGSFMYEHDQGVNLTNRNRYVVNIRQDFRIAPWISLDLTTNLAMINDNNRTLSEFTNANNLLPYMMLRDANGNNLSHAALRYHESIMHEAQTRSRLNLDYVPLDELNLGFNTASQLNARINAGLRIRLMEGLHFEGRYQYQRNNGLSELFRGQHSYSTRFELAEFTTQTGTAAPIHHLPAAGGRLNRVNTELNSWTVRNQFLFDRAFDGGNHQITALAGTEVRANRINQVTNVLRGFDPQTLVQMQYNERDLMATGVAGVLLVPGALNVSRLTGRGSMFSAIEEETRFVSFYSNVAYTFSHRYSINASIRVDQSNLFGSDPSVQFRPIWSTGVAWNLGQEDFMRDVRAINRLNLRLSYGLGGNSPAPGTGGSFDIIQAVNNVNFPSITYTIVSPANNQLRWEQTRTLNFGIDVSAFNSRIHATIDIYDKKTTDLLGWMPLNTVTGWHSALGNLGELTNRGFELTLSTRNVRTRDFAWTTMLTLTHNVNNVERLYNQLSITPVNRVNQPFLPGYSASSLFAFQWAGLDHFGDPQVFDIDANGNLVAVKQAAQLTSIHAARHMGSSQPLWFGGITNSFTYRNFELSFLFVYNLGHKMRSVDTDFFTGRLHRNIMQGFENRWREPGDEMHTNTPSYLADPDNARRFMTFYTHADINVVSASYIKLRDLSLSYTLPQSVSDRLLLQSARVRVQAGNLFYWAANNRGIDPEAHNYRTGMRQTRFGPSFSAGLTVNFR